MKAIVTLSVLVIFLFSCGKKESAIQGEIIYQINYLNINKGNILLDVLPEELTVSFKDKNICARISCGFGVFSYAQIYNHETSTVSQVLKNWNEKYYSQEKINTNINFSHNTTINTTKSAAGLNCADISEWLTEKQTTLEQQAIQENIITLQKAIDNKNMNPENLPGFELVIGGLKMKLVPVKVSIKPIGNDIFEIPANYKAVNQHHISGILDNLCPV